MSERPPYAKPSGPPPGRPPPIPPAPPVKPQQRMHRETITHTYADAHTYNYETNRMMHAGWLYAGQQQ